MIRVTSPPLVELSKLNPPLSAGERLVIDFFNRHLSPEWEFYIKPHLNGLRPDIVLLRPQAGIAIFEIRDFDLDSNPDALETGDTYLTGNPNTVQTSKRRNPVHELHLIKTELANLYCPRLAGNKSISVISAGAIFPFSSHGAVQQILGPTLDRYGMRAEAAMPYYPISGKEPLAANDVKFVFPEAYRSRSMYMSPETAQDLRSWLVEPDHSDETRDRLELDSNQIRLATTRTSSGFRRIKGPAGSGKSLVLAARVSDLVAQNKSVLVITFNLTLINYLRELVIRCPEYKGNAVSNVTWYNFHYWCKIVCEKTGHQGRYRSLWKRAMDEESPDPCSTEDVLNKLLPELVAECIDRHPGHLVQKYDAILVDEGQDFLPEWWAVLRKVRKPDAEMLLAADVTQDVYQTASTWTEQAMQGAGFTGPWVRLDVCYRLPQNLIDMAGRFATSHLKAEDIDLPTTTDRLKNPELDLYPCHLRWVQTPEADAIQRCHEEFLRLSPQADPQLLAITDIVFLSDSQQDGEAFVNTLKSTNINCSHTFSGNSRDARKKKQLFFMGHATNKATTIHSFKGWEARAIVLLIGARVTARTPALVYTGLTRLKRHREGSWLTVVCAAREYREFGRSWPDFQELGPPRHQPYSRSQHHDDHPTPTTDHPTATR
ncbi:helicase [Thiorhodovibrio winogradskyi]|uniref:Helicase n=1 Tax=Thiorhodovibrio winogradskyi TaxID=77007 RepID=A0ABZ0SD63_9GAMM|nr:UvrD-helicase domain-containing protein [Thiorhodovibrio winogradskyi]